MSQGANDLVKSVINTASQSENLSFEPFCEKNANHALAMGPLRIAHLAKKDAGLFNALKALHLEGTSSDLNTIKTLFLLGFINSSQQLCRPGLLYLAKHSKLTEQAKLLGVNIIELELEKEPGESIEAVTKAYCERNGSLILANEGAAIKAYHFAFIEHLIKSDILAAENDFPITIDEKNTMVPLHTHSLHKIWRSILNTYSGISDINEGTESLSGVALFEQGSPNAIEEALLVEMKHFSMEQFATGYCEDTKWFIQALSSSAKRVNFDEVLTELNMFETHLNAEAKFEILRLFFESDLAPKGWSDLTQLSTDSIGCLEVKSTRDKLTPSQILFIINLRSAGSNRVLSYEVLRVTLTE